jgi:CubicO group peptidase (beta-lactamase class C family)
MEFLNSFQSEWLKMRRSSAVWLTLFGGLFVPALVLTSRLIRYNHTLMTNASDGIWIRIYDQCWEIMSFFLLPVGITLAASLTAQIEYRNNTWKQTLTTPQRLTTLFFSKYVVVLLMMVVFFILFNLGIFVAVMLPAVVYPQVPFPKDSYPFWGFLYGNSKFFLCCLPVLGLQYLLSTHIRNFLVPIIAGIALVIASLMAISWKYSYLLPYAYAPMQFLKNADRASPTVNYFAWAFGYFMVFTLLNYFLFINKNRRTDALKIKWKSLFSKKRLAMLLCSLALIVALIWTDNPGPINTTSASTTTEERIKAVEKNIGFVKYKTPSGTETALEARMKNYGIQGLTVAVINDYKIDWVKSYGWADIAEKRPLQNETLLIPGSISKSVNALSVMKLYEKGQIDLFADINTYLKSWQFPYDSTSKGKKINMAHLLSHSAGLSVHGFGFTAYAKGDSLPTIVQILEGENGVQTGAVKSVFEPNLRFQYSGGGTMISQLIQMDLLQKDYANLMNTNVLQPIGMHSSFFDQPPPKDKEPLLATGYTQVNDGNPVRGNYPVLPQQAAAGLWTNATDLANMVVAIQKSLRGDADAFLKKPTAELMLTPYNDDSAALGFFVIEKRGTTYFQHAAGNPGFAGHFIGSMKGSNGVVVLFNSDSDAAILEEVITAVAYAYHWEGYEKRPEPIVKEIVALPDTTLADYTGIYRSENRIFIVENKDNSLFFNNSENSWPMFFTSKNDFFNTESKHEKIFSRDENGHITGLTIPQTDGKPIQAEKVSIVTVDAATLQTYTGNYCEKTGEKTRTTLYNQQLWIHSENAPKSMLAQFLTKTDFIIGNHGVVYQVVIEDGAITGIKLRNGRLILTKS